VVCAREGLPTRSFLFASFVALAAAVVLGVAPSAQATTNIVPNPVFETDCAGVPCNWIAGTQVMIARDTTIFHTAPQV